jgi:hypothetical protein
MLGAGKVGVGENRRAADAASTRTFADLVQHATAEGKAWHLYGEGVSTALGWREVLTATHIVSSRCSPG